LEKSISTLYSFIHDNKVSAQHGLPTVCLVSTM
jgi:hypothetical protein